MKLIFERQRDDSVTLALCIEAEIVRWLMSQGRVLSLMWRHGWVWVWADVDGGYTHWTWDELVIDLGDEESEFEDVVEYTITSECEPDNASLERMRDAFADLKEEYVPRRLVYEL